MRLSRRTILQSAPLAAAPLEASAQAVQPPPLEPRWIWHPERRTLSGTFVFFRRAFYLQDKPVGRVQAWVTANSRYQLWVNGRFVQRGPAPCDPRYWDIDPVDLGPYFHAGENVIGAIALHYGGGDGTWVPSTPPGSSGSQGFWFKAEAPLRFTSDEAWRSLRARCWPAGSYQRWFLRALQEEFDARHWPAGWCEAGFDDSAWRPVQLSRTPPDRPNLPELGRDGWRNDWRLRERTIPPLREQVVQPARILNAAWVDWKIPPEEYFESFPTEAFTEQAASLPSSALPMRLPAPQGRSFAVTFDFGRILAGHLRLKMRAPAGAVAELLFVENQAPGGLVLRTRPTYGQWVRVTARDGVTEFESFEYDALRYLQVLVRNSAEPVELLEVSVNERNYAWPHEPDLKTSDEAVNRGIAASVVTHKVCSQETIVDNVTRERQQYAGDLDHAKLASYYGFGEYKQPRRMLETFSQGQGAEGWFPDSWPAWDRCARLWQRHMNLAAWGPLIDHSLEFGIAAAKYYLFTGDRSLIELLYPKLKKFDRYLWSNRATDQLLPRFGWAMTEIWIDHTGFKSELDKHCAVNLYYAGFLKQGIARLARWLGDTQGASDALARSAQLIRLLQTRYWDPARRHFVDNRPRQAQDGEARVHERTLAMAYLYDAIPKGAEGPSVDLLESIPADSNGPLFARDGGKLQLGFSYPLNGFWRLWALGRAGRAAAVVRDVRDRWGNLRGVKENGCFSEDWEPRPSETGAVWCQNVALPLTIVYEELLGIRPTEPGFQAAQIRPRLGGLDWAEGTVHTVLGPLHARAEKDGTRLKLRLTVPPRMALDVLMPNRPAQRFEAAPETTRHEFDGDYA
jgi:hypothetical protein